MSSQFEKRRQKAEADIKAKREKIRDSVTESTPTSVEVSKELTHEGYDICLAADGRKYEAIIFAYNPVTRQAEVKEILPIQRQVALSYQNHKKALKTLLKR